MTLLQCIAMLGYAVWLIIQQFTASDASVQSESPAANYVGLGTAAFIIVIFGFLAWVAIGMLSGRSSGTGAVVLVEACLFGIAIYMFRGGATALGAATMLSAVIVLISVFHPASWQYSEAGYEQRKAQR